MNNVITVKQLRHELSTIMSAWWWDRHILLTSDDEINDLHYMRDWVVAVKPEEIKELDYNERVKRDKFNYEDFILLW